MLDMVLHTTISQLVAKNENENGIQFLRKLYSTNNESLRMAVAPIYLWSESVSTFSQDSLTTILISFNKLLAEKSNFQFKTERYGLLTLNELKLKIKQESDLSKMVLNKIIRNLQVDTSLWFQSSAQRSEILIKKRTLSGN